MQHIDHKFCNIRFIAFISALILIFLHLIFIKLTAWQLPPQLIQQNITIQGVIDSVPSKKFHGLRFQFHAEKINHQKISTHFLISWYEDAPQLQVGQRWKLFMKLKPPIGLHNPGGFNYQAYLIHHDISATGYVMTHNVHNQLINIDHAYFLASIREKIHDQITYAIANPELAAFISALCVGLRDGLTENDWQIFQKTGTNHLVAIAGLHIGFVAATIYVLANFFIKFFPRVLLIIPASRFSAIMSLFAALCYTVLSGFAIPAERASIMLFCLMMAQFFYHPISLWQRWFIAILIILFLNPFDVMNASFWLSFISIAMLMFVMSHRLRSPKHIISWIKMQAGIIIGLLPLILLFFQQASSIAFFTNAVAIPWIGFIILPMSLLATVIFLCHGFFLSEKIFWLSGKCLAPLWKFLKWSSHLHFASWHHVISDHLILILAMIGVIFLIAPHKFPAKYLGCLGLLPLFFCPTPHPKYAEYWVSVIDVGQGLSVLVQTERHVMLYDTGSHMPGGFDMGESVVAPYLRYRGIQKINRLEISHGDNDHSGGAASIVKDFPVQSIFTSAPKLIKQFHAQYCATGQSWTWDGVHFSTLNPALNSPYEDNNSSCTIKISSRDGNTLLTGDIQKSVESDLVSAYGHALYATLLIVPHHGSRTSSSENFLEAVTPQYAVISAGKYNRYHLPAISVVNRYQHDHIHLYNTADDGAVIIRFLQHGQVKLTSARRFL